MKDRRKPNNDRRKNAVEDNGERRILPVVREQVEPVFVLIRGTYGEGTPGRDMTERAARLAIRALHPELEKHEGTETLGPYA